MLQQMSETEAIAAGLTVIEDLPEPRETPAETADRASRHADELAAVVESMLQAGRATRAGLELVRDQLGALHVEFDELAHDLHVAGLGGAA